MLVAAVSDEKAATAGAFNFTFQFAYSQIQFAYFSLDKCRFNQPQNDVINLSASLRLNENDPRAFGARRGDKVRRTAG